KYYVKPAFCETADMAKTDQYEVMCDEIVRLLKVERERRKLSNYAVSQNTGVSEATLSRIERRLHTPSIELLLRIAGGIGIALGPLVTKAEKAIEKKSGAINRRTS
ncbi:MAG TPA: helix-turn-helix transcriptional regulator, partial [Desulfuromonadaceae bacterium]|nr:helix-turn-helix transcriptional regulator [Desulfuromonadaceae bacterium]